MIAKTLVPLQIPYKSSQANPNQVFYFFKRLIHLITNFHLVSKDITGRNAWFIQLLSTMGQPMRIAIQGNKHSEIKKKSFMDPDDEPHPTPCKNENKITHTGENMPYIGAKLNPNILLERRGPLCMIF